ncbi:MAG: flagellar hook-basal body complex protein FliE [Peptococcales bacterium]|jgi:flagellar hook-basal body complex protein FliE
MNISSIDSIKLPVLSPSGSSKDPTTSFNDVFKKALGEVNKLQMQADAKAVSFTAGESNVDIHDVMIEMEKAHLALQLTIETRNKIVEGYQEIMRMQV